MSDAADIQTRNTEDATSSRISSNNNPEAVASNDASAVLPTPTNQDETAGDDAATDTEKPKKKAVRRIVRRKKGGSKRRGKDDDSDVVDPILLEKVMVESNLPKAYSFEIVKTLKRINQILQAKQQQLLHQNESNQTPSEGDGDGANQQQQEQQTKVQNRSSSVHIALQMPEGLLLYATVLSDVLQRLVAATNKMPTNKRSDQQQQQQPLLRVSVLGDVTYGACCVDDLGARALGCDLLVHYGHSCLVPIQHTAIPCLYVFVEITIDVPHLVECFHRTMLAENERTTTTTTEEGGIFGGSKPHVYLMGTIQFRHALMEARRLLRSEPYEYEITIPQAKPLSPGEVLGCTSPVLASSATTPGSEQAVVLFVADGRFHLESTMISNPLISRFYRYDPYPKTLTEESYDHTKMKNLRYEAIEKARRKIQAKKQQQQNGRPAVFGIILGTLGRQGNPALLTKLQNQLRKHGLKSFVILASEITPSKLALFRTKVDAWVQIACPRLSVDWGHHLSGDSSVPVLNPYELFVCLDPKLWRGGDDRSYPMDYYSQDGGPWSNYGDTDNKGRRYTIAAREGCAAAV